MFCGGHHVLRRNNRRYVTEVSQNDRHAVVTGTAVEIMPEPIPAMTVAGPVWALPTFSWFLKCR